MRECALHDPPAAAVERGFNYIVNIEIAVAGTVDKGNAGHRHQLQ